MEAKQRIEERIRQMRAAHEQREQEYRASLAARAAQAEPVVLRIDPRDAGRIHRSVSPKSAD